MPGIHSCQRGLNVVLDRIRPYAMHGPRRLVGSLVVAAIAFCGVVRAESMDVGSLPAVKKAVVKAKADVRKNRRVYDEANEKVFLEAEKALKAEVERLSKAGMPEEAVAVKKFLADFRQNVVKSAEADEPTRQGPGAQDFARSLVGKWDGDLASHVRVMDADGSITEFKKPTGGIASRGKITAVQSNLVVVELENKFVLHFRRMNDGSITCTVLDPGGKVFEESVVRRIE